MALQDCINKFEKAGAPIRDEQVRALQAHIANGMTDDQAVRAVHLAAHQNVVDIASRAVNEGAVLAPVTNALTDALQFQAKALEKLNDKKEVLNEELDTLNNEYGDINTVNSYFRTLKLPGAEGTQNHDLTDRHVLMDLMLHYSFKRPDIRKGAVVMGLEGKDHMGLMKSFDKLQARREEIQERFIKLDKEQTRLDEQVEVIWSGKKQTFYQSDFTRLTVVHNLSSENLIYTDSFGGLPVPSLAVVKEGANLTGFGEISFIGTESLADPTKMPIYDADGYTIRTPAAEYKPAKVKDRDQLWGEVLPYVHQWEENSSLGYHMDQNLSEHPNPQLMMWNMIDSHAVRAKWLIEEKGEDLTPTLEDYTPKTTWALDPEIVAFMDGKDDILNMNWEDPKRVKLLEDAAKIIEKVAIRSLMNRTTFSKEKAAEVFRQGAYFNSDGSLSEMKYRQIMYDQKMAGTKEIDTITNQQVLDSRMDKGNNRHEFKMWIEQRLQGMLGEPRIKISGKWEEYNLENVTRAMKGKLKGKEFMGEMMTEGLMRALVAHRFTKLKEMRQRADKTITTDKDLLDELRVDSQAKMNTWLGEVSQFYSVTDHTGYVDHFRAGDDARRAIVKWAQTTGLATVNDLEQFMNEAGYADIPEWLLDEGMEVAMTWLAVPVPYFEAKPQRAVMLDEFAGAVIPSDASPEVKAVLAKHRIPYKEYQVGNGIDEQQTRADALSSFTEQLNKQGERTLFQSEIGFTSGLLTAAQTMPRESGTKQEMMGTLLKQPNVKKQELDAVGVEEWMEGLHEAKALQDIADGLIDIGNLIITREELVKFIEEGGVQVKETFYAGVAPTTSVDLSVTRYTNGQGEEGVQEWNIQDDNNIHGPTFTAFEDPDAGNVSVQHEDGTWLEINAPMNNQTMDDARDAVWKYLRRRGLPEGAKNFAKWTSYTLDGGTNHREILLHLPEVNYPPFTIDSLEESENIVDTGPMGLESMYHIIDQFDENGLRLQTYQISRQKYATLQEAKQYIVENKQRGLHSAENFDSHAFKQKNIIVWTRVTDRIGPNGEKIFFIEEAQSDLHQAGLTQGYRYSEASLARERKEFSEVELKARDMLGRLDEVFAGYENASEALRVYKRDLDDPAFTNSSFRDPFESLTKKQHTLMRNYVAAWKRHEVVADGGYTPDLPFKGDAWAELAMKRMIRLAVEGGYDQVAWTTGEQQLKRYDIDEHFGAIEWDPRDEMLYTYDTEGNQLDTSHRTQEELEDMFGAERLLEMNRQIDDKRSRWAISPVYLNSKQRSDMFGEELAFAEATATDGPDLQQLSPNDVILDDDDQFIDSYSQDWLSTNGVAFALMDENGEMVRQAGGAYQMWEYYSGAEEGRDDFAFAVLPELTNIDMVDEEGKGLRKRYDELMVNVTNRALKKLDKGTKVKRFGLEIDHVVEGASISRDLHSRETVHGFDISGDVIVNALEGQPLFQGGNRASITFDATNKAVIRLSQSKDPSSFIHELGHLYLEMMGDLSEMPDATPATIDQYARMLTMLGVNNRREIGVKEHELLARSFEGYIREGKAPTAELQADFSRMRGWMIRVYRQIERLLGVDEQLNDEGREMFDRMVATEDQIKASEDYMGYVALYANAEEMGVTQRVFDHYRANMDEAHNEAVDHETEKMIKAMQWGEQKWWREELKNVQGEVRAEAEMENVYKALYLLQRGTQPDGSPLKQGSPFKLSKDDLIRRYGKDFIKRLPRPYVYSAKGGMDADLAAPLLGYGSGNELIQALIRAPKMEEFIKVEADRRMKERHPDPLNDTDAIDRATREVHNEKRARVLAAELSALRKKQREDAKIVAATKKDVQESDRQARDANKGQLPKREDLAHIKAAAKQLIESKKIRDVNPNVYLQAERKAGRLAFEAMGNKKYAEAYEYKRKQIMNYEAYRAAIRAKAQAARDQKYLTGFEVKRKRERMGKAGVLEQIDAILDGINFKKISMKQIDRDNAMKGLRAAVEDGRMVVTPATMAKIMNENVNWQELTFEEFAGIRDVIKQLEHQAKANLEILINGEKVIVQEAVDAVAESIANNNKTVVVPRGEGGPGRKAKKSIRGGIGHWLRSSSIARILDDADFGAVTQRIIEPIRRAYVEKLVPMLHKATEDVAAIYQAHYSNEELGQLAKPIEALTMGEHMSKSDILALALNWGSESNRQAVLGGVMKDANGIETQAYTEQGVAEALAKLDARDWAFVQDIWDYQNSYWDQLAATEKGRRGIAPQKIEALPFEIQTSDGQTIQVRGGYHHLQYNSEHGGRVSEEQFNKIEQSITNGQHVTSNTRAGSTYERVQNHGKVVKLTLNTIDQNLREVIRDMTIGDEVRLVSRILHSEEVSNASRNTNTDELVTELKLWLSDAAVGELPAQSAWEKGLSWVRVGFTKSKLAFNVYVTALQLTGVFQSMAVIGTKTYSRGVGKFISNPSGNYKMVMEKSHFMNARYGILQTWDKDVQDTGAFLRSMFGSVPTKFKTGFDKMGHYYFYPIAKMQSVVDVTTWMGAYEKGLNEMTLTEDKAILFADTQVEASQTSGLFSDRSGIERGTLGSRTRQSQFVRLWTTLISYMLAKGNIAYEKGAAFKKNPSVKDAMYLATDYIMLFMIEGIASSLLYNNWPGDNDEDESVAGWVGKVTAESVISGIPLVREYSAAKYGSGNTPVGALITDTWKFVEQASQGEADEAFVKAGVKVTGTLFHLPASQVNRAVEAAMSDDEVALYEYFTGKRDK